MLSFSYPSDANMLLRYEFDETEGYLAVDDVNKPIFRVLSDAAKAVNFYDGEALEIINFNDLVELGLEWSDTPILWP